MSARHSGQPLRDHLSVIDLNTDAGESSASQTVGDDRGLMPWISSASVAAGFHAGDPSVLRSTIRLAKAHGVSIGAHPSFPDREGFGRREMQLEPSAVEDLVLFQIASVAGVAAAEGLTLSHVKPHGALYNMAARDMPLARAIARASRAFSESLVLFAPAESRLFEAGRDEGLRVAAECFADRAYEADGSLANRSKPGALLTDSDLVARRVIRMVRDGEIETVGGTLLSVRPDTICIHSDTPGAAALAAHVRTALEAAGVRVAPVSGSSR